MIREGGLERDRYHTSCETGYHECDRWRWVAPTPSPKTTLTQSQLVCSLYFPKIISQVNKVLEKLVKIWYRYKQ